MEKDRTLRIISVIALAVAILGVTVGFAAWSATLQIISVTTNITSGQDDAAFKNLITIGNVTCEASGSATASSTGYGSVSQDGFTWSGASVGLTKKGDSVTCEGTVSNQSSYVAYFDSITIGNGTNNKITCSLAQGATGGQGLTEACNSLRITAWANDNETSAATVMGDTVTNRTVTGIASTSIASKGTGKISFKVEYVGDGIADANFVATLPTITFGISSVD